MTPFSLLKIYRDFFLTLKGSYLHILWSDPVEFRTHVSSYVCHPYLQDEKDPVSVYNKTQTRRWFVGLSSISTYFVKNDNQLNVSKYKTLLKIK